MREGSWAEPGRPLIPRARGASPENFSPNCPGNVRGRERERGSRREAGGSGPLGRGENGGGESCPSPQPQTHHVPKPVLDPLPREPGIQGMESSGRRNAEPGGAREGGRAAGGRRTGVGLALPHSLIFFFFTRVGMGCFLVALKRRNTHETGRPPPTPESRHGTPSPRGPARCAPELGSSPRARARVPTPRPGRLHSGEGMLIRVGPARDGGGGERRQRAGGAGRGAGRAVAKRRPPAAGPRSPGRSRRGLTQCRAARRAEPAPRPAYWASARRDRGLQQITN